MPIRMWLRRTWWVLPVSLVLMVLVMRNVQPLGNPLLPGWRFNWGWMLGVWNGGTMLLSPFLAAVAALMMIREWPYEVRQQTAALPRGRTVTLHIAVAIYTQGLAAMVIALGIGVAFCVANDAHFPSATLPWQLFTGPAALLCAIVTGQTIGVLFGDLLVVPLVAFGMFLAHQIFFWWGFPELFTLELPTTYYEDARPMESHLGATVALNLVVAAGFWLVMDWLTRVRGMRPWWLLGGAVLCFVAALAIYLPWVLAGNMVTYERFQ